MELISREEALRHLKPLDEEETDGIFVSIAKEILQQAYDVVEKLPTIENRPKGKWKQISPAKIYECFNCHGNVMTNDIECYNFCHQCGADMRGGE